MELQGIFIPIATPFDYRGDLYVSKIHYNLSRWNRTTVSGYVVGAEWGEARLLTAHDRRKLWEQTAQANDAHKTLCAAVSSDGVQQAVEAIGEAHALGYQAAVVEPSGYPGSRAENRETQLLFLRSVADRVQLPVLIANPAAPSAVRLDAEAVVALAGHPNVVGVIDAAGDLEPIQEVLHSGPDGFQVLAGADGLLCEALEAGVAAVVPSLANPLPFFCLSIAEAVRTRELDSARELQRRAAAAVALTERYGIPGLKYAMDLKGYYGGSPRLPLLPLGEQAQREITEAFRELSS